MRGNGTPGSSECKTNGTEPCGPVPSFPLWGVRRWRTLLGRLVTLRYSLPLAPALAVNQIEGEPCGDGRLVPPDPVHDPQVHPRRHFAHLVPVVSPHQRRVLVVEDHRRPAV